MILASLEFRLNKESQESRGIRVKRRKMKADGYLSLLAYTDKKRKEKEELKELKKKQRDRY